MSLSYKGSSFGLDKPTASASATFSRKPAHLTTNPLNPWFLSNGIPDFSPQIDKEYKVLAAKRKLSQLIQNGANDDDDVKVEDTNIKEPTSADQASKKVKPNDSSSGVAAAESTGLSCGNDEQESGTAKGNNSSGNVNGNGGVLDNASINAVSQLKENNQIKSPKTTKVSNESDSIAKSLLKTLKTEKAKSKLLEEKIMSSFAATTAKESKE